MPDDQRAVEFLAESVARSISNIERGVKAYVFQSDDSAYGPVSTELRKLLLDRNAVASFRRSIGRAHWAACLLELHFGSGEKIFLKSFRQTPTTPDEYMDITPDVYAIRADILHSATKGGRLVTINKWLEEDLAHDKNGNVLKVGKTIDYIAGREGSHIIDPSGDIREDVAIAFVSREPSPENIPNIDFNHFNSWRQFVIDAGMRLLSAQTKSGERLINHTIAVPTADDHRQTLRVQKKRPR